MEGERRHAPLRWAMPADFDYSCSSADAYATASTAIVEPFATIRAALDYCYHQRTTPARQQLQGQLIQRLLHTKQRRRTKQRPWLVFTAGAMGAGKSHAIRTMAESGDFPLGRFTALDPDAVKGMLPEAPGYAAAGRVTAATMLHRESGLIVEIAQEAALRAGGDLLIDGSLRDAAWHAAVIADIRRRFPLYRLAIVHVVCAPEIVQQRCARRARVTGREVPAALIDLAIEQVPKSVAALSPLVDAVFEIDSSGEAPRLTSGTGFGALRATFADSEPSL